MSGPPRTGKSTRVVVATHGHCFDGAASAALFTRLWRSLNGKGASFRYRSCGYGAGMQALLDGFLDGADNAVLDFRFTPSPRLGWYFDHHATAFASEPERDAALQRSRVFWDASYGSCAKLIADMAEARFDVDMSDQDARDLVRWAEIIDAARFGSALEATSMEEPVLQLAAVIERHGDGPLLARIVPRLADRGVAEVARDAEVQALWAPLRAARGAYTARVLRAGEVRGPVVFVDLTDGPVEAGAKFATYAGFPACAYSVTLTRTRQAFKLSVGYNPWCGAPRAHDIASICQRYDGGGHPAVGACTFPLADEDRARAAARSVTEELGGA